MRIFCIDSTSYIPRVAIVDDGNKFNEKRGIASTVKWNNMTSGDVSYIIDDFFEIIDILKRESDLDIGTCDLICYSGCSGFQSTMNLGKIFAKSLGALHGLEVISVDHITAHYFSQFTQNRNCDEIIPQEFPILFFSASGSHNSLALLKSFTDLTVLHDKTHFDTQEQKFIGLGSIYFRACKACEILGENDPTEKISEKLNALMSKPNESLVELFLNAGKPGGIFDMNFHDLLFYLEENIQSLHDTYKKDIIFLSFEEAIFRSIEEKLKSILFVIPCRQISIVGGISQNDNFFNRIKKTFEKSACVVTRPDPDFRFDNASMLGTLAHYMKKYDVEYPASHIIT